MKPSDAGRLTQEQFNALVDFRHNEGIVPLVMTPPQIADPECLAHEYLRPVVELIKEKMDAAAAEWYAENLRNARSRNE